MIRLDREGYTSQSIANQGSKFRNEVTPEVSPETYRGSVPVGRSLCYRGTNSGITSKTVRIDQEANAAFWWSVSGNLPQCFPLNQKRSPEPNRGEQLQEQLGRPGLDLKETLKVVPIIV
jgi:hypothetical protein